MEPLKFDLRLPIEVIRRGRVEGAFLGETLNLSAKEVLFKSAANLSAGDLIEYAIILPAAENTQVRIHCIGKVVRCEDSETVATVERYEFLRAGSSMYEPVGTSALPSVS